MTKPTRSFRPDVAARVLAILEDGTPPFLTVAARRASFPEKIVEGWVRYGAEEYADPDEPQTAFALEVKRVQAEYMAEQTKWLCVLPDESKNTSERARKVAWVLSCLDRNVFDLSRPPREAPKGETNKPAHKAAPRDVAKELETPELDS